MNEITLKISEDGALALFDFFERFGESGELYFVHPAEYISPMKISAQIDKSTPAMFNATYAEQLRKSREIAAKGYEGDFPAFKMIN